MPPTAWATACTSLNLATGEMRALDGAAKDYDGLAWGTDSTRLAVLRGEKPEGKVEKENMLLAWTDGGAAQAASRRMGSREGRRRSRKASC